MPLEPLPSPIMVSALDGGKLTTITHKTKPISLIVSGNHWELIQFLLFSVSSVNLILGYPWLIQHNPHIFFSQNWSFFCLSNCLRPWHSFQQRQGLVITYSPPLRLRYRLSAWSTPAIQSTIWSFSPQAWGNGMLHLPVCSSRDQLKCWFNSSRINFSHSSSLHTEAVSWTTTMWHMHVNIKSDLVLMSKHYTCKRCRNEGKR